MATGNPRNKTQLKKGFGLMDWVKLISSSTDLAGLKRFGGLKGYRIEEIRQHHTEHDAWAVFMGKVYNITPYLHYHPGGADIMIKAAGRDCTALFNKHHPWVNLEGLAGKLIIGYLIEEDEGNKEERKEKENGANSSGGGGEGSAHNKGDIALPDTSGSMNENTQDNTIDRNRQFAMDPPPLAIRMTEALSASPIFGSREDQEGFAAKQSDNGYIER